MAAATRKEPPMKERILAIILLLLAGLTIWAVTTDFPKKEYAQPAGDFTESIRGNVSTTLSSEVIRLHILADSDSENDQAIKLAVRDALLPHLQQATINAATKEEALAALCTQCSHFKEVADAALACLGTDYTATISIENLYFPIRIYGSQTYLSPDAILFPPDFYDSVQVVLGSGQGHNWWCLAYPSLCFLDATYDYIPKNSDIYKLRIGTIESSELSNLFYAEESEKLLTNGSITELSGKFTNSSTDKGPDIDIYFGSKLLELLRSLFAHDS